VGSLSRAAALAALVAAFFGGFVGCAAAPPRHHNHRPVDEGGDDPKPPPPLGPWTDFGRLSTFQAAGDIAHSAHRIGTDSGHLLRSPDADASFKGTQPVGALFVEALSPEPTAPIEAYFIMRRTPAASGPASWEYLVATPDGTLAAQGNLGLCVRCHAEAGPTGLFPP